MGLGGVSGWRERWWSEWRWREWRWMGMEGVMVSEGGRCEGRAKGVWAEWRKCGGGSGGGDTAAIHF